MSGYVSLSLRDNSQVELRQWKCPIHKEIAMHINLINLALSVVVQKSGEIVMELLLKKFWEWLLRDENLKRLSTAIKLKILVLYLDWLLHKSEPGEWEE